MKCKVLLLVLLLAGMACQAQNQIDKQGRRQGHWLKTDNQGAKVYEGTFVDGLETGTFTYFYPDGKVRIRNEYSVPGKICQHTVYDAEGNMQVLFTSEGDTAEVSNWNDNHRHGRWWKRIGKKGYITATYVHGGIEGKMVEYDDNGYLVREGHYVNGDRQGAFLYYEDGQKVVEETWSKGVLRDKLVRLKVPEEMFVSVNDINFMVPQGKNKTLVYLPDGTKLLDEEEPERLYDHVGDGRFTLANKEARIMVATELIVGTTRDSEGREILSLDPMPDFVIYPDEDCVKMLKSLQMQKETIDAGGQFDFD